MKCVREKEVDSGDGVLEKIGLNSQDWSCCDDETWGDSSIIYILEKRGMAG